MKVGGGLGDERVGLRRVKRARARWVSWRVGVGERRD